MLAPTPFKEVRDYAFSMRDYKGETISYYHSIWQISYLQNYKVIAFEENKKIVWKMIYLSQITFIFLTQICYNMDFITSSSMSSQDSPGTLRSIFVNCFLRTFFCSTQKTHIFEYIRKTCLKEFGILLKCRETFEKFLAACNSSKNTGLLQFF